MKVTEDELAQIEAEHTPYDMGSWTCCASDYCSKDGNGHAWPCPMAMLVAEVRRLRAFVSKVADCRSSGSWYCPADEAEEVLESQ